MFKFILATSFVALTTVGIFYIAEHLSWTNALPSYLNEIVIFIVIATVVIYGYLNRFIDTSYFVQMFLLSMVIKMIASLAFITVIVFKDKVGVELNVALFLALYMLLTAVEIVFLHPQISKKKGG